MMPGAGSRSSESTFCMERSSTTLVVLSHLTSGVYSITAKKTSSTNRVRLSESMRFPLVEEIGSIGRRVDALLAAGANDAVFGEVFNLGHPEPLSLIDFVSALHEVADFEHEIVPFPPDAKAIDIGDYYGDFSKFAAATGWRPQVGVATGLERTLAYHRRVGIPSGSEP